MNDTYATFIAAVPNVAVGYAALLIPLQQLVGSHLCSDIEYPAEFFVVFCSYLK
jgi:hypothetical protein